MSTNEEGEAPPPQEEEPPPPVPEEEEEPPPPADKDFYQKVSLETAPAYRFQLVVQPFDFGR